MRLFKVHIKDKTIFALLIAISSLYISVDAKATDPSDKIVHPDTWSRLNVDNLVPLDTPFRETYDVNSGMLGFSNIDVSLPGNFSIPLSCKNS